MKIIIATGIFPPDIGGPATYSEKLAKEFKKRGIEVRILCYSDAKQYGNYDFPIIRISRRIPKGLRHFLYFLRLLKLAKQSDVIYALTLSSFGLPVFIVSKILRKKFIVRLGGDFLWERAVEKGKTKNPLRKYYQDAKSLKEKFLIFLIKKILRAADKIIFTSDFQKEIYKKYFSIKEQKAVVIPNPFPEIERINNQLPVMNYQLLYAGRLIKLKKLDTLIEAFAEVLKKTDKPLVLKIIGEGPEKKKLKVKSEKLEVKDKVIFREPISHQELLKEIQESYFCVLPSLTEISPNFALECIKLRKPILLTRETGIYEDFKDYLIFIDPKNKIDFEQKILYLLGEKNYQNYIARLKKINVSRSWEDIIEEHLLIFKRLCPGG